MSARPYVKLFFLRGAAWESKVVPVSTAIAVDAGGRLRLEDEMLAILDESFTGAPPAGTGDYATAAQGTTADSAVQPAGLTKAAVGLGSVDNTSDAAKPVSTATQSALDTKGTSSFSGIYADLASKPVLGTAAATAITDYASAAQGVLAGTAVQVAGLTKAAVGLGSADNTADTAKPVSTAQQTALDGKQPLDADLTTLAGLTATTDNFIVATASAWASRTPTQARSQMGLGTLATQSGTFSGTSSNTNTGDQTTVSGNAGSATVLQTTRAINGVNFDGSAPITVTAAAGTLSGATLASGVTASSLTSFGATPTLTTPVIGVATGTSLAATGALTSSGTAGIGYATGAGGTVTQLTNRSTGVTLSKLSGAITTNTTSLAALAIAVFTVTNTLVAVGDVVLVSKRSGFTNTKTDVRVTAVAAGSFNLAVHNIDAATAEVGAGIINFLVLRAVSA